jgi:hypothetical protein
MVVTGMGLARIHVGFDMNFASCSRRVPGTQFSFALMTFFGFSRSLAVKDPARNPDFTEYERDVGRSSVSSHSL